MKRIGVIGAGRFGQALVESLSEKGVEVVLVDISLERIQEYADYVSKAVQGDASSLRALRDAGIDQCDVAVICIGDKMEGSIMATVNCKDLGVPTVISKAVSDAHGKILKRVGADIVIYPDRDRAQRLAKSLISANSYALDILEIADGVSLAEIEPPPELIGKTIIEGGVRQNYGITVLVIRRPHEDPRLPRQSIIATGKEIVQEDDRLIVFGDDLHIAALGRK